LADAPANLAHDAPLGVPMPTPITTVAGGDAAVSTTVTVPVAEAVKAWTSLPRTPTVPVIVSVVSVTVGAVVVVDVVDVGLLLELPQAAASTASPSARAVTAVLLITNAEP
jgi:hypothetical protein